MESTLVYWWWLNDSSENVDSALHQMVSQTCQWLKARGVRGRSGCRTFFRSFPLMWQSRLVPSKHMASRRPFPSIFNTWAYSGNHKRGMLSSTGSSLFWARTLIKKHWQLKKSLHEYSWCVVLCCDIKCKYMWPQRQRQNMMFYNGSGI